MRAYLNPFHTDDIFVGYAVIAQPRCTAIAFHEPMMWKYVFAVSASFHNPIQFLLKFGIRFASKRILRRNGS